MGVLFCEARNANQERILEITQSIPILQMIKPRKSKSFQDHKGGDKNRSLCPGVLLRASECWYLEGLGTQGTCVCVCQDASVATERGLLCPSVSALV